MRVSIYNKVSKRQGQSHFERDCPYLLSLLISMRTAQSIVVNGEAGRPSAL